jgi:hypothetical protein
MQLFSKLIGEDGDIPIEGGSKDFKSVLSTDFYSTHNNLC